jgi:glycosyltransferase involved in cell wall biosynthesis
MVQFALPHGAAVRAAAQKLGLPYVVQLRGDDVWVWPHRGQSSLQAFIDTLRDARLVLAVSRALLEEAQRLCGRAFDESAVVPNGVDLNSFRPARSADERREARASLGVSADEAVVLCVGDLIVRKGWFELLDALASIRRGGGLRLVAAAPSPVEELNLQAEARIRAPHIQVHLERGVDRDRLAELYRAADVFCLPSHSEGMANALIEAMASGLPCVTTAVAGHPEVVTTEVDGILVPPRNAAALSEALQRVITSASLRESLGRAARARAEGVGNSHQAGSRLSQLLDGVRKNVMCRDAASFDPYSAREDVGLSV